MSPELERLVGRVVTDKDFRDKLLADPEGAVKDSGFNLSADELDRVKNAVDNVKQQGTAQQLDQQFGTLGRW